MSAAYGTEKSRWGWTAKSCMKVDCKFAFGLVCAGLVLCVVGVEVPSRGRDHKPLGMRLPVMMILLCLSTLTSYLEKMATQSSSHSCESEMSVPVFRSSSTKADWAAAESCVDSGS